MQLSPMLYHKVVRPRWITKRYIHRTIAGNIPLQDRFVLDFGSGTGANCTLCSPDRYMGVEPDGRRVEFARRLYPHYRFLKLESNRIPLDNHSVDVVMIVAVLHHISNEDLSPYLGEFARVLKPGGRVVALEPCLCDRHPICSRFMSWYDNGEYLRTQPEYFDLFRKYRYECREIRRFRKCLMYHELFFTAALSGR